MVRTSFQFVLGTHEATPVPAAARAHGLTHRCALVQSTAAAHATELVVDPTALLVALAWLDSSHARPGVLFWDESRRQRATRGELETHYRTRDATQFDVVRAGEWRHADGQLAVLLATEPWAAVGGPAPYHDSYTYSFYSAEPLDQALLAALRSNGCEPVAVLHAESATADSAASRWAALGLKPALACLALTALLGFASAFIPLPAPYAAWADAILPWLVGPSALALVLLATEWWQRRRRASFSP